MTSPRTPRRSLRRVAAATVLLLAVAASSAGAAPQRAAVLPDVPVALQEYRLDAPVMEQLRTEWLAQLSEEHAPGTWAPMKFELSDSQLALLGLPPAEVLASR